MTQAWQVIFYKTPMGVSPVEDFVEGLSEKEQAKAYYVLRLLAELGPQIQHTPHSKSIQGEKNLFELRIKAHPNIHRIFYFHYSGQAFVLLHGFTKKTQATPPAEIKTARQRRDDYLTRKSLSQRTPHR